MSSYSPADMINTPPVSKALAASITVSWSSIAERIAEQVAETVARKGACRVAVDGHAGSDWSSLLHRLTEAMEAAGLPFGVFDVSACQKSAKAVAKMVSPCLPEDPTFGRIYEGILPDFFDAAKLGKLSEKLRGLKRAKPGACFLCYGSGAAQRALRKQYDLIFYIDLAREEILKRLRMGLVKPLGLETASGLAAADAQPAYFSTRRLYYIDYVVLDAHRRKLLPHVDYYIDGNDLEDPKMLRRKDLLALLDLLLEGPITPKPYYDPGPWGGQWLKKIRKLPPEMKNCAWSYDLISPETSLQAACGDHIIEIPFPVLNGLRPSELAGTKGKRRKFRGQFPLRINYDDSLRGGDMALQAHPDDAYIKANFNEPFRQDESYYIVDSGKGARVYLGLQEDTDVAAFRQAVIAAEQDQIPFDHHRYANSLPSAKGDLFLIPAGTLHASGRDNVVLEISATTYRYTFHFYDYLRPGLDGKLRAIHCDHAFNVLKTNRRSNWVKRNLKQEPRLLRQGRGWAECLLGLRHDLFFRVHRLEFDGRINGDTQGEFHLLVVVEGVGVRITPRRHPKSATDLPFSCLAVAPATMGAYKLEALGAGPCKVVKVLMR